MAYIAYGRFMRPTAYYVNGCEGPGFPHEADPVSDIVRRAHAILYVNLLRLIEIANTVTEMFAYCQLRSGFRHGASV